MFFACNFSILPFSFFGQLEIKNVLIQCLADYLEDATTKAIMFQDTRVDPNLIVVAFRGTEPFDPEGWRTDVDLSWYEFEGVGKTHSGFMKALGLQKNKGWPKEIEQGINQKKYAYYEIRQRLRALLQKNENAKFILTGHSLGAALAILFLTVLAKHEEEWLMHKLEGVYTFGQPRVGDNQLGGYMEKKLKQYDVRYFRFVYCNDIVPRIPYDDETLFFTHFGPCLYYNSFYKGKVSTLSLSLSMYIFRFGSMRSNYASCWSADFGGRAK